MPPRPVRSPGGTYQYDVNDAYYVEQAYVQRLGPARRARAGGPGPARARRRAGRRLLGDDARWQARLADLLLRAGLPVDVLGNPVDVLDNMGRGRRHGGRADLLDLPAEGGPGNSPNPMMDANSDQVAGLILDWLASRRADGGLA